MTDPQKTSPNEPEIIYIADDRVACDGGGGPIGHPRIYLSIDSKTHMADCGYCDRRFVRDAAKAGVKASRGHH